MENFADNLDVMFSGVLPIYLSSRPVLLKCLMSLTLVVLVILALICNGYSGEDIPIPTFPDYVIVMFPICISSPELVSLITLYNFSFPLIYYINVNFS